MLAAALSVNDKIQTIGAIAGLAAIPGLAVLALLYFGQAREVKRLREWAGRAPERAAELEARVAQDAARRVQAQPLRPAQPATPAAQQAAAAKPNGTGEAAAVPKPAAQPATAAAQAVTTPPEEGAEPKTEAAEG